MRISVTGITELIGADNIYDRDGRVGAAVKRAYEDAVVWVKTNRQDEGSGGR